MTKSIHVAITLSILTAAAGCAEPLERDFFHVECGPDQVGWFDEDGDATCAELDAPDSRGEPNEPPEPPPAPEAGDLDPLCVNETPIEPLPDPIYDDRRPERALDLARAPDRALARGGDRRRSDRAAARSASRSRTADRGRRPPAPAAARAARWARRASRGRRARRRSHRRPRRTSRPDRGRTRRGRSRARGARRSRRRR